MAHIFWMAWSVLLTLLVAASLHDISVAIGRVGQIPPLPGLGD